MNSRPYTVECHCGASACYRAASRTDATSEFERRGWVRRSGEWLCPEHSDLWPVACCCGHTAYLRADSWPGVRRAANRAGWQGYREGRAWRWRCPGCRAAAVARIAAALTGERAQGRAVP